MENYSAGSKIQSETRRHENNNVDEKGQNFYEEGQPENTESISTSASTATLTTTATPRRESDSKSDTKQRLRQGYLPESSNSRSFIFVQRGRQLL